MSSLTTVDLTPAKGGQPTRDYLKLAVVAWGRGEKFDPHQWLLDHGRNCGDWSPLPSGVYRGPMKACFHNAVTLAKGSRGRYVYCEGYASSIIPALHAWCIDRKTGLVVDPTWDEGVDYIGVPVRWQYAMKCLRKEREAVMNWAEGYPIMTGATPAEVWRVDL